METFLVYTFIGLNNCTIYAVMREGLVLTYTTTGIFNFSHGAIGMLGVRLLADAVRLGLARPSLALVLLVLAPLFGVFLEVVIMRNLEGHQRGRQVGGVDLAARRAHRSGELDLEPERAALHRHVLPGQEIQHPRHDDDMARSDHDHRRDRRGDRLALPAVPDAPGDRDARDR